jgi:hypothetical protein
MIKMIDRMMIKMNLMTMYLYALIDQEVEVSPLTFHYLLMINYYLLLLLLFIMFTIIIFIIVHLSMLHTLFF